MMYGIWMKQKDMESWATKMDTEVFHTPHIEVAFAQLKTWRVIKESAGATMEIDVMVIGENGDPVSIEGVVSRSRDPGANDLSDLFEPFFEGLRKKS